MYNKSSGNQAIILKKKKCKSLDAEIQLLQK